MSTNILWISEEKEIFLLEISDKNEKLSLMGAMNRKFNARKASILVSTCEWESVYADILLCSEFVVSF